MIRPIDLKDEELWCMFQACIAGDLHAVQALAASRPSLARAEYNYTPPLHFAVREGHLDIVRFLLDQGASLTYRTYPFQDSLLTMAQDRDRHEVASHLLDLLARQFPVKAGLASFLEAAAAGDIPQIETDLARDPSLARASDDQGDTALHRAAFEGHMPVVTALLDAGADVDAVRADGFRPIHCAFQHKTNLQAGVLAGMLLARGARYNIYLAAVIGDDDFVEQELERDPALANFADTSYQRPLSAAARRNDLAMVKTLLDHGANPSLPEHGAPLGQALWLAVYQKQTEMARVLLEHGANPNTAPESSGPAILHARHEPELRDLLIKYGAVEDTSDRKRLQTLISDNKLEEVDRLLTEQPDLIKDESIFWAEGILAGPANNGNTEMIKLLFRHGAHVPDVSKWGPNYYFKHTEIASLLLDEGMNPNHGNWYHFSLLHHMAAKGDMAKARLLLDHGADVNAIDEEYRSTALGCAARWGQQEMAALLLERGADPNKAGAPWATPIAWATKKGHAEIEAILRAAGAE